MKKNQATQFHQLINQTFQDITLCLGGIFLLNETEDKLVWTITNSLEDIYLRTIMRLGDITGSKTPISGKNKSGLLPEKARPHPAIEGLLRSINMGNNRH